jgi:hypothetical protein
MTMRERRRGVGGVIMFRRGWSIIDEREGLNKKEEEKRGEIG